MLSLRPLWCFIISFLCNCCPRATIAKKTGFTQKAAFAWGSLVFLYCGFFFALQADVTTFTLRRKDQEFSR
jgi:hypothetical protein